MSACTIPFGSQGKVEVGKRKADGMTTEIILNKSEAAACRKTLTRPLPKGEEKKGRRLRFFRDMGIFRREGVRVDRATAARRNLGDVRFHAEHGNEGRKEECGLTAARRNALGGSGRE